MLMHCVSSIGVKTIKSFAAVNKKILKVECLSNDDGLVCGASL